MPPELNQSCFYETSHGAAYQGDSVELMRELPNHSVAVICTSPPFPLLHQKKYSNVSADDYVQWFLPFATEFRRILLPEGSLVIDLDGTWLKGLPYRSLYHYELLLKLCKPEEEGGLGFFLAQELYWYNPAKLSTPAEWVTVRRIRVKDAVNTVWWLRPSAVIDVQDKRVSSRRVLNPHSEAQKRLMRNGYKAKMWTSEHSISDKFGEDNKGAIPPALLSDSSAGGEIGAPVSMEMDDGEEVPVNMIVASNTASNDRYLRRCREEGVKPHPVRFPADLPRFIIGLCSEEQDLILDPFAGSNMTGAVAQEMNRTWLAFEKNAEYLKGSTYRFPELESDEAAFLRACNQKLARAASYPIRLPQGLETVGGQPHKQGESLFETTTLGDMLLENTVFGQYIQQAVAVTKALSTALQPASDAIASLSAELSRTVEPYRPAFAAISSWEASLAARMEAISAQWVIPDLFSVSMMGFARLARLRDVVHDVEPYSDTVSDLVASELGRGYEDGEADSMYQRDEMAMAAGLKPELIAFPSKTYLEVLAAAGFEIRVTSAPPPQTVDSDDAGIDYHPESRHLFVELEQRIRHFVEAAMGAHYGSQWIKLRVPNTIRQRWKDRREKERNAGRDVFADIQYSNFMDLNDIICRADNWRDVFKPVFRNKDEVAVSFRRLLPVRNAIAHSRPLGRADVLLLYSEATRLLATIEMATAD